jgi:hypothetical protein
MGTNMVQLEFNFFDAEAPEMKAAAESARLQDLRFEAIARMVADRNEPIYAIARKIATEIAATIKGMMSPVGRFQRRLRQVHFTNRMKALRELRMTLVEGEGLSKQDLLNLEGPKFKFIFGKIIHLFRQALLDAGTESFQAQGVMVQFGDLLSAHDEALRRELNRIDIPRFPKDVME